MEGQDGPDSSCLSIVQSAEGKEGSQRLGGMLLTTGAIVMDKYRLFGKEVREETGEEFSPV